MAPVTFRKLGEHGFEAVPLPAMAVDVEALSTLGDAQKRIEALARESTADPPAARRAVWCAAVLSAMRAAVAAGDDETLETLAEHASSNGGAPLADAMQRERSRAAPKRDHIEDLAGELRDTVAKLRANGESIERIVTHVQQTIGASSIGLAVTDESRGDALRRLHTKAKQESDESIVSACFRAVGYKRQLFAASRVKSARARAKKKK